MTDAAQAASDIAGGPGDDHESLSTWAYEGEVCGAVLLEDLLTRRALPEQDLALRRLLRPESETRDVLRPLVDWTGLELDEEAVRRSGLDFAAAAATESWSRFLDSTQRIALDALPSSRRLLEVSPTDARPVLHRVLEHEETLLASAQHTSAGRDADALSCLDGHLQTQPVSGEESTDWVRAGRQACD